MSNFPLPASRFSSLYPALTPLPESETAASFCSLLIYALTQRPISLPGVKNDPRLNLKSGAAGHPPPAHAQPERRAPSLGLERLQQLLWGRHKEPQSPHPPVPDLIPHLRGGCGHGPSSPQNPQGTLR